MSDSWAVVIQAVIVSIPGLLAWRDAHRAHAVSVKTEEKVDKVVSLVNGQQSTLNEVVQKATARADSAEGALAESHRKEGERT